MKINDVQCEVFDDENYLHCAHYKSFNYLDIDQDKDLRVNKKLELAARIAKFPLLHQIPSRG